MMRLVKFDMKLTARRTFLSLLGLSGLAALGVIMNRGEFMTTVPSAARKNQKNSSLAPALFIGHGSPMNALEINSYTQSLQQIAHSFQTPKSILCISAHWMTRGTWVTHMAQPKTIHDFYGFPKELFSVQYPAAGSPKMAEQIQNNIQQPQIHFDDQEWGLDHGTWAVLKHIYPQANIPVVQMSIDMSQPMSYHFDIGQKLQFLRQQGVMILGSGNIVHNLRQINWDTNAQPHSWAVEFDQWVKEKLVARDFKAIQNEALQTAAGKLSVPTLDHWIPLMYVLGAALNNDELHFDFEGFQNASMSMRSLSFRS